MHSISMIRPEEWLSGSIHMRSSILIFIYQSYTKCRASIKASSTCPKTTPTHNPFAPASSTYLYILFSSQAQLTMALAPNFRIGDFETNENGTVKACPQAMIETPQHRLTDWIKKCGGPMNPLGRLAPCSNLRVGIIGGGCAGVTAAFEAVKAGATVTLVEARPQVGGRARSVEMDSEKMKALDKNFGEEGSMRFPPSEACLYLLAEAFGYGFIEKFPDPGVVPTLVCYAGRSQLWIDLKTTPKGFETVTAGWRALVAGGCVINGKKFASAVKMADCLRSEKKEVRMKAREAWQDYIDEFKDDTFLQGMKKIFSKTNTTPPAGTTWTEDDFDRFGKLGIGSGGFGAFYSQCFLTIWRFMPNQWEKDQSTFAKVVDGKPEPSGIRELWQSIYEKAKGLGLKTLLNTKATAVSKSGSIYKVVVEDTVDGQKKELEFDELFINVTLKVADVDLKLRTEQSLFPKATRDAIGEVHMARTTKLFIKASRDYFKDKGFPRVLLTDGNLPQLYCLDYGDKETIVIMVVYAWEAYSENLEHIKDPKRLFEYLKGLAKDAVSTSEYPNWADCLVPIGEIPFVHWQDEPTARGAFTFALPGQDRHCATLFYDYEKGEGPYLIGDSFSFGGGWTEPALETAYTCISAMLKRRGQLYHPELAPVNCLSSSTYKY